MKTMVIYDDTGYIFFQLASDSNKIPEGGIQYLEIEVPQNKRIIKIDTSVIPHIPIYEDIPIPEIQVVKQQLEETQTLLAEYIDSKYNALLNY